MNESSGGIGLAGVLGIVFIILKLTGTITWPWVWVLAPFWIPVVLVIVGFIVFAILGIFFAGTAALLTNRKQNKETVNKLNNIYSNRR